MYSFRGLFSGSCVSCEMLCFICIPHRCEMGEGYYFHTTELQLSPQTTTTTTTILNKIYKI